DQAVKKGTTTDNLKNSAWHISTSWLLTGEDASYGGVKPLTPYKPGPDGGWGTKRVGSRFKEFSPAHNISADDPPAIVFLGRNDNLIPVATVERFQNNMKAAGVRCETRFYTGQGHGFFNQEPWKTITLAEADKFLASLGWLKGEPTLKVPETPVPSNEPQKKAAKKAKQP
ncbi:MAG: hypothetical protein EB141_11605, partial [Verrucomicrobia bacterium]|nr:hypothetical protein [Verrucomicrobiota bacterium]